MDGYEDDPEAKELVAKLHSGNGECGLFTLHDGLIRCSGRVWLGNNELAQQHVMLALHSFGVSEHSGFLATLHRIKQLFAWPNMKKHVKQLVAACETCQQAKVEHVRVPGLLQPLPIVDQARQTICMDFIEGLPKSNRFDTILVVIDKFTKYAHFISLSHPFTALQVA